MLYICIDLFGVLFRGVGVRANFGVLYLGKPEFKPSTRVKDLPKHSSFNFLVEGAPLHVLGEMR